MDVTVKEERKARVLEAIARFTDTNGYPPSYRDLADLVYIAHSAVFASVESLRTDGLIHERKANTSRAITLTPTGRAAVSRARTLKKPKSTKS